MKIIKLALLLLLINTTEIFAQIRCATMEADASMRASHPEMGNIDALEKFIKSEMESPNPKRIVGDVYTIPVVIHIIHNGEAVGVGTNISDAQVQSQIDVLNEDFRKIIGTAGYNTHPDGADTKIEFCLAKRKPDGTATTGIDRINRSTAGFTAPPFSNTTYIDATIKPATQWDPTRYFNLWCLNLGASLLGYAQFPPSSSLTGFSCNTGSANSDGVVIQYNAFGRVGTLNASYNLGRTATHEVGHWLGLRHIWGDATCGDDFCNDTPVHQTSNTSCYTHPKSNTCGTADEMFENYMDYSLDACLSIFTNDQKTRMRTVLTSSPLRVTLINSDACIPPATNDAAIVDIVNPKQDICVGNISPIVTIKNFGSANLTAATINYKLDNGTLQTQLYTGNLTTLSTANITLSAQNLIAGVHSLKIYCTLPNGATDANPALDTIVLNFTATAGSSVPYNEAFESNTFPPASWLVNNVGNDCFTFREQTGLVGAQGTTTTAAFLYHYLYTPGASETDELTTQLIDLTNVVAPLDLEFDLAYARKSATQYEDLKVEISTDCGQTYSAVIYNKNGNGSGSTDLRTVATNQTGDWKPAAANNWRHETISLNSYLGNTIRLKFTTTNRGGNNIYIDNIKMDNAPKVAFQNASAIYTESSSTGTIGCTGYLDVSIPVTISSAPASNVVVTASVVAITATASDANIIGSITFVSGSTASQNLTFRVYDDEATESDETLSLILAVSSGPASVSGSAGAMAVTISDNDIYPYSGLPTVLLNENFESTTNGSLPSNWTTTFATGGNGNNNWMVGSNGGMSGTKSCYVSNDATIQSLNYDVNSISRRRLVSPSINTTGATNLVLSFDWKCNGEKASTTFWDYGRLMYATNAAGPYTDITGPGDATSNTTTSQVFFGVSTSTNYFTTLPVACENQAALYLVWRWDNDGSLGNQPPFTIDNVTLKYYPNLIPIETALNATATKALPGNSTVYFLSSNNKLLAKIKNNSSFDYGCVTVTLDRVGATASEYWSAGAANYLADKTLTISTTNNNAIGALDVTMYYTTAEVAGWQTATTKTFTSVARIFKSNGNISSITSTAPLANGTTNTQVGVSTAHLAFGSDRQITSSFTSGIKTSGIACFGVGDCANRIITGTVSSIVCSSNSISIPFVALGLFNTGNIFTAQLSSNLGSFSAPTALTPTITAANNGYYSNTIIATNTPLTSNAIAFRFRVSASNPTLPVITDNGTNITIQPKGMWLGITNNASTTSNWCGGLPTTTTNVELQTGVPFQPSLTANLSCANVNIPNGTNISLNNFGLSVYGNFLGSGVIKGGSNATLSVLSTTGNTGIFYMDNTSASTKTLKDLTLNISGTTPSVGLGDTLNLEGTLTLSNGTLTTNSKLKLISNASTTSRIAAIAGTGAVSGNVISQRYALGGLTGWSMMSNAVVGDNILNWQDDFATSGFAGSSGYAAGFTSLYSYSEATMGLAINGYVAPTNATDVIANGKGYMVYLGTGFTNTSAIAIDATGAVRQGNFNLPITYTASTPTAIPTDDGWNLVANPYCSTIDWNSALWTKTNIANATYIYNADIQNYATYVGGVGTNGGTNIIAQNQAFWVKATAASPVLQANEGIKISSNASFLKSTQTATVEDSLIRIKISKVGESLMDEAVIRFCDAATNNFDDEFDASERVTLAANGVNIYTSINNFDYSINSVSNIDVPNNISVPVKISEVGSYSIELTIPSMLNGNLFWKDNELGTQTPMQSNNVINYSFTDTATTAQRFEIVFTSFATKSNTVSVGNNCYTVYPNPSKNNISIYSPKAENLNVLITDVSGKVVYNSQVKTTQIIDVSNISSGVYTIKIVGQNNVSIQKIMKE